MPGSSEKVLIIGIPIEAGKNVVQKTPGGADKFWELSRCLKHSLSPLDPTSRANLEILLELRHEIEHRSTNRIDDAVSAKLQACCINFNDSIKSWFGAQYALERRLPIALQFVTFSPDQRALLKRAGTLPRHIETVMDQFEQKLSTEEQSDPRFAYRVYMIHKTANAVAGADTAIEVVPPGSERAAEVGRFLLKEVEKRKYLPAEIVSVMKKEVGLFLRWTATLAFGSGLMQKIQRRATARWPSESNGVGTSLGSTGCGRNAQHIRTSMPILILLRKLLQLRADLNALRLSA